MKIVSVEMYIHGINPRSYTIGIKEVIEISEMSGDEAYGPFVRIKFEDGGYCDYSRVPYMVNMKR